MFSDYFKKVTHSKPKNETELKGAIRLRRLRLSLFFLFLGYLPYGGFVMSISPTEQIGFIFIIIYFCVVIIVGFLFAFALCPRCRKIFTWKMLYANGFTSKCVYCGLSIRKQDLTLDSKQVT